MRLTADLVRSSQAYMNPLRERELSLRGYKIPTIENLGVTADQYQVLDLSDNDILKLDNFPLMTKLEGLLLNNNKIIRISKGLGQFLPKLTTLMLTNNRMANLKDLLPLRDIPTLTHVSFTKCPVSTVQYYRLYLVHKLPNLKVLDFIKVSPKERESAFEKYGKPAWALKKGEKLVPVEDEEDEAMEEEEPVHVQSEEKAEEKQTATPEQREKLMEKIKNATSLTEIESLEKMLKSGHIPAGFL